MRTVVGTGCWPGKGEGPVVWIEGEQAWSRELAPDRSAEVFRFRAELGRALGDLEAWSELQQTVEARLLLQAYRDALLEDAWSRRACASIDTEGLSATAACMDAAERVAPLLARSEELQGHAGALLESARWLATRLSPPDLPAGAILAASRLNVLELLDRRHPALVAEGAAPAVIGRAPLVWGVPGLGPDWNGRRVAFANMALLLDAPSYRWWQLTENELQGHPVCHLNGDPPAIDRMAHRLGRKPAVILHRLDDLAAVPLFAGSVAAIAVNLDKLGPAPRLKHPGLELLLKAASAVAAGAGVPMLAGGEPVTRSPEHWLAIGFTGFYGTRLPQGGFHSHAVRGRKEGGL